MNLNRQDADPDLESVWEDLLGLRADADLESVSEDLSDPRDVDPNPLAHADLDLESVSADLLDLVLDVQRGRRGRRGRRDRSVPDRQSADLSVNRQSADLSADLDVSPDAHQADACLLMPSIRRL